MIQLALDIAVLAAVVAPLALALQLNHRLLRFFDAGLVTPFLFGGYAGFYFGNLSVGLTLAAVIGVLIGCLAGTVSYLVITRPLIRLAASPPSLLLATLGVSIITEQLISLSFGTSPQIITGMPLSACFEIDFAEKYWIAAATLTFTLVIALCLDGAVGVPIRAVIESRDLASTFGLNPDRWMKFGALLSSALAAVAGVANGILFQMTPLVAMQMLLMGAGAAFVYNRRATSALIAVNVVAAIFYVSGYFFPDWQHAIVYGTTLIAVFVRRI